MKMSKKSIKLPLLLTGLLALPITQIAAKCPQTITSENLADLCRTSKFFAKVKGKELGEVQIGNATLLSNPNTCGEGTTIKKVLGRKKTYDLLRSDANGCTYGAGKGEYTFKLKGKRTEDILAELQKQRGLPETTETCRDRATLISEYNRLAAEEGQKALTTNEKQHFFGNCAKVDDSATKPAGRLRSQSATPPPRLSQMRKSSKAQSAPVSPREEGAPPPAPLTPPPPPPASAAGGVQGAPLPAQLPPPGAHVEPPKHKGPTGNFPPPAHLPPPPVAAGSGASLPPPPPPGAVPPPPPPGAVPPPPPSPGRNNGETPAERLKRQIEANKAAKAAEGTPATTNQPSMKDGLADALAARRGALQPSEAKLSDADQRMLDAYLKQGKTPEQVLEIIDEEFPFQNNELVENKLRAQLENQ